MKTTLYFAYGSNMDGLQMRRRCSSARVVGPAMLNGYRLTFAGHSITWGGGVATLEPSEKANTVGVIYRISIADLARLDMYEGHPCFYQRKKVKVELENSLLRNAETYILSGHRLASPSADYLIAIIKGYRRFGFDLKRLNDPVRRALVKEAA